MKVISRKEAIRLGAKRYFTGKSCPERHIASRLVSNFACAACLVERKKTEKYREQQKEYARSEVARMSARRRSKLPKGRASQKRSNVKRHQAKLDWQKTPKGRATRRAEAKRRYARNPEKDNQKYLRWASTHQKHLKEYRHGRYWKDPEKFRMETKAIHHKLWGLPKQSPIPYPIDGGCQICGGKNKDKKLFRDHCHKLKKDRGWLCRQCNIGLGHFRDNPNFLNAAIKYLETSK